MSRFEHYALQPRDVHAAQSHGGFIILDVREPFELQICSVAGAVHIPMSTLPQRLHELDVSVPIACLCHHGVRSHRVAMWLQAQGYETYNIEGGIDAWADEVEPQMPRY